MNAYLLTLDDRALLTVAAPLLLVAAAWTLRLACWICALEMPEFGHAFLTLLAVIGANIGMRAVLRLTETPPSMLTQYAAPTLVSAAVIAVCLATGPYAALLVSVVHAVLTAGVYIGALVIVESLLI